ncbi:MAG: hypothetical protein K9W44_11790 [Candidatus Lokiarchaeota archaeon]|nr:hypothetical protein [Candidatus Harpocratesius repetitus]
MTEIKMNNQLMTLEQTNLLIESGKFLMIAGDEKLLLQLKKGNWIAGTIPYFMDVNGGVSTRDECFVTVLPDFILDLEIKTYDKDDIKNVFVDSKDNGINFIIIPAMSEVHFNFALNAPIFKNFGYNPLIGWIAGVHLDDINNTTAKTATGLTGELKNEYAVVIHGSLPDTKYAEIDIVNIFTQGSGDEIQFLEDSFKVKDALINGKKQNFAEYLKKINHDTRFPLVADYMGVMINISYQSIDEDNMEVNFYAPVFKGQIYKNAEKLEDYVSKFEHEMPKEDINYITFSCNCILNYLYSELEGKKTEGITGPITFGEIGYQLLNQTLVYITIKDYTDEELK